MRPAQPPELERAFQAAAALGGREALDVLYNRLPHTVCARRGHCCGLLPPAHAFELVVWLAELLAAPPEERLDWARRLVEHFLCNASQRRACPWLEPGRCSAYDRRFFGCRAYGLRTAEGHRGRALAAAQAQEAVARAWAGLGLRLPAEVLAPGPPYCRQVKTADGAKLPTDETLDQIEDRIIELGARLPGAELAASWGGDASQAVAFLALGPRQALTLKVAATKAALDGRRADLRSVLERAASAAGEWVS